MRMGRSEAPKLTYPHLPSQSSMLDAARSASDRPGRDPPFRERVLEVVASIPSGRVMTYGGVAVMADRPRAARGVGSVLNAHGEGVPWWRVVNAQGHVPSRPTARLHRALLEREGVVFEGDRIDLDRFAWVP